MPKLLCQSLWTKIMTWQREKPQLCKLDVYWTKQLHIHTCRGVHRYLSLTVISVWYSPLNTSVIPASPYSPPRYAWRHAVLRSKCFPSPTNRIHRPLLKRDHKNIHQCNPFCRCTVHGSIPYKGITYCCWESWWWNKWVYTNPGPGKTGNSFIWEFSRGGREFSNRARE